MSYEWPDERFIRWAACEWHRLWLWLHTSGPAEWLLVIVGGAAGWAAWLTLSAIQDDVEQTKVAVAAAATSAKAAADTLATNQEIERAYITFGHRDVRVRYEEHADNDGGWIVEQDKPLSIDITVSVTNAGRTPGDVLGGFIGYRMSKSGPGHPDVTRALREFDMGFLLPRKHFSFQTSANEGTDDAGRARLLSVLKGDGTYKFWLVGEIDYEDRFGGLHTCGYGRVLLPADFPSHPTLVADATVGSFNFDHPMTPAKRQHYGKPLPDV